MDSRIFNFRVGTKLRAIKFTIFLGIACIIVPSIFIIASILTNPWFTITANAFSDLGAVTANNRWIFNCGMIVSGSLIFLFALGLAEMSENKVEVIGSAFLMMTAFFLIFIGIFYEGTAPHFLFSVLFFSEAGLSVLTWGLGMVMERRYDAGIAMIALAIIGTLGSLLISFPSIALLESFGISIMFVWVIIVIALMKGRMWREL